ncbi:MAG TPA: hypothetical protein VMW48_12450, partial [Vicinamibacterales bacterium]|nr:hypothetical protein [Vicinamibacterales bacterium]
MRKPFWVALVLFMLVSAAAVAQQSVIVLHDPWLNWDFINNTGQMANDFHLIVESPGWMPLEVFYSVYPMFNVVHGDNNGDGIPDTMLTWADAAIMPGMATHIGAYMLGSGRVLDAYWTLDGVKLESSLPITYELTEILDPDPAVPNDSEIHMLLQFAPGYYADPANRLLKKPVY